MKRFTIITLMFIMAFVANAQSYILTKKIVMDKFNDILLDRDQKTIVTKTDSTFVIEEKGRKPVTYRILNYSENNSKGDKDNIVNLIDNVYGYQEWWDVILESDVPGYNMEYTSLIFEPDKEKRNKGIEKLIERFYYCIIHRVVTTQYTHRYLSEHFCVRKAVENGMDERTIYSR